MNCAIVFSPYQAMQVVSYCLEHGRAEIDLLIYGDWGGGESIERTLDKLACFGVRIHRRLRIAIPARRLGRMGLAIRQGWDLLRGPKITTFLCGDENAFALTIIAMVSPREIIVVDDGLGNAHAADARGRLTTIKPRAWAQLLLERNVTRYSAFPDTKRADERFLLASPVGAVFRKAGGNVLKIDPRTGWIIGQPLVKYQYLSEWDYVDLVLGGIARFSGISRWIYHPHRLESSEQCRQLFEAAPAIEVSTDRGAIELVAIMNAGNQPGVVLGFYSTALLTLSAALHADSRIFFMPLELKAPHHDPDDWALVERAYAVLRTSERVADISIVGGGGR